ncbi:MAG: hypothetical protein Q8764_01225 [Pigeon pea little leaf phytoplasma]|nr:hypothetical protein [Sweet potato little leaf phytoplasma]MDV3158148.1 hypothetical protein [Pigeon pea little leaf phytoplasma]MDV3202752.1 hypothetical protein [Candidatus Phytoplasma stylosanthis]MDV3146616.1 hypothetical protein [Sweet potato little leaf phytoplasma]MDV3146783.1 hypothetical protein [Sweet potato little leaf phytoplasma]
MLTIEILNTFFQATHLELPFHVYMQKNHSLLNQYFKKHSINEQKQHVLRGKINELLILRYLKSQGINNLYPQAYLFFIPDIKFDLVLFSQTKRIFGFSIKTCLRERYKQAVIEGQQLKKLDSRFRFYLLTNDLQETKRLNQKIIQGKVPGIDAVINCFSPQADLFIQNLLTQQFTIFTDINLIKKNKKRR